MSVIAVSETHDGREGEETTDAAVLRRVFWVRTDSTHDNAQVVLSHPAIPQRYTFYFDGYNVNLNMVAKRRRAENQGGSQKLWKVEIEYEAKLSPDDDEENPTLRPAEYAWSDVESSEEMTEDSAGQKVQNSVKQPFDPAVERDKTTAALTITRNESSFSSVAMDDYKNTLNGSPIFGYASREGRMKSITATSEFDAKYGAYWRVTYVIYFRKASHWVPSIPSDHRLYLNDSGVPTTGAAAPAPWDITRRNNGTQYRKDAGTKALAAKDDSGLQESDPVDLKPNGTRVNSLTEDPYWWIFKPYLTLSWYPLRLEP